MQQSAAILDLCLRKTRAGISHDYRDAMVFRNAPFSKKLFSVHTKMPQEPKTSSALRRIFLNLVWIYQPRLQDLFPGFPPHPS